MVIPRALLPLMLAPAVALAGDPRGKVEFEEAKRLFDRGQPAEALPMFEEAVLLSNRRPSTLLALALCQRELGLHAEALAHLDEYLQVVPADRDKYASIRTELEAAVGTVEAAPPPPAAPPPAAAPPPSAAPAPSAAPPPPPAITAPPVEPAVGPSALKIGLFSAGGAAIVTGVVFAVLAARAESDVKNRVEQGRGPARVIADRAGEGFRFAITADVLVGLGVVAAGAGFFVD